MAKKFTHSSQQLKPDPKHNSKLVSKFINCLMLDGKKSTAQRVFYDALDIIGKKITDCEALEVFEKAINGFWRLPGGKRGNLCVSASLRSLWMLIMRPAAP